MASFLTSRPQALGVASRNSASFGSRKTLQAPKRCMTVVGRSRVPSLRVNALAEGVKIDIVEEANAEGQVKVKCHIPGDITKARYDEVVQEMKQNVPANMPGFRTRKGSKPSVSDAMLVRLMGKSRIVGFVIESLATDNLGEWAEENDMETDKKVELPKELKNDFKAGEPMEFETTLQLISAGGNDDAVAGQIASGAAGKVEISDEVQEKLKNADGLN